MKETQQRHLFLTGEVQVGKSTILRRFLDAANLPPEQLGGFQSAVRLLPDQRSRVYLVSPGGQDELSDANCIMTRQPNLQKKTQGKRVFPEIYPEIFEKRGMELLQIKDIHRLILMDELGFAEREAPAFRKRVLEVLDGDIPVLGVLKQWPYEFLEQVAQHPAVTVIRVTEDNRDRIAALMTFAWSLMQRSALQETPARESSQNTGKSQEIEKIF